MKTQAQLLALAIAITSEAFKDKLDKGGQPYIFHCLRVMNRMPDDDYELQQIAVMHDLIEDTSYTLGDLESLGFSDKVRYTLWHLTHSKSDTYEQYIDLVSTNKEAIIVKLADLKDNSNITRLKGIEDKDIERMIKYHKAFLLLSSIKFK